MALHAAMNPEPRPRLEPENQLPLPFPEAEPPPVGEACAYWDHCPNCGARLHNAGCKYRCTRCHYFMSCSDFD